MRWLRGLACGLAATALLAAAPATVAAPPASGFTIWTVAGNGGQCAVPTGSCGDGGLATDAPIITSGVAFDSKRNMYVSDYAAHKLRKVAPDGTISTIAGTGVACSGTGAACGDGPNSRAAQLNNPGSLTVDAQDNVYVSEEAANRIRRISPSGAITTVVGTGTACPSPTDPCGDGGPGASAQINLPAGLQFDNATGDLYFADGGDNRFRRLDRDGVVHTFAGSGVGVCSPGCGDGGPALVAQFSVPLDLVRAPDGGFYVSDLVHQKVRRIAPDGTVSTIAGTGAQCAAPTNACGDGGSATSATFSGPQGLAVDRAGGVIVVDRLDFRIRRIQNGRIDTVAGSGEQCSLLSRCGDGGSATEARFGFPTWLETDPDGNGFYVTDGQVGAVRWLAGPQSGPAGADGQTGATGPGGPTGPARPAAAPSRVATRCTAKRRKGRSRPAVRCVVTWLPKNDAKVTLKLKRRSRTFATGAANGRRGKATIKLKVRRAVPRGRYSTAVTIALVGRPVASTQTVIVR